VSAGGKRLRGERGRVAIHPAFLLGLAAVLVLAAGCGEDDVTEPPLDDGLRPGAASPAAVLDALQSAYRARDIDAYAGLLASDFTFAFQPADGGQVPSLTWNRDQDSTGTHALFHAPQVSDIRVDLTFGEADTAEGMPEGVMHIRTIQVQLEVDEIQGITWRVVDLQDFFFRAGVEEQGESPAGWFLLEWRDLPSSFAPGLPAPRRAAAPAGRRDPRDQPPAGGQPLPVLDGLQGRQGPGAAAGAAGGHHDVHAAREVDGRRAGTVLA